MLVPGCSKLRNHGARAGSAFGGGSASAEAASSSRGAKKRGLITRAQVFPQQRTPFHDLGAREAQCQNSPAYRNAVQMPKGVVGRRQSARRWTSGVPETGAAFRSVCISAMLAPLS